MHWLKKQGHEVAGEGDSARQLGIDLVDSDEFAKADLAIAFGGDGSLIRTAHLTAPSSTPILGVFFGRFGFVTQCTGDEVKDRLRDFIAGRTEIEDRMMIESVLIRNGQSIATMHSLNEVILQRDISSRMMTFCIEVDGRLLASYPSDGVIVSTPTGSTAYNLSAGGPIMDPRVQALILTAVSPHTLNSRPLVLAPESEVRLAVESAGDAVFTADGQTRLHLLSGDELWVRCSKLVTRLVSAHKDDFLEKVGHHLRWSQGMLGDKS